MTNLAYKEPIYDENTWWLNRYEDQQEENEMNYLNSLPEKYEEIVAYARDILVGECDNDVYYLTFEEYYEQGTDTYNLYILATIDAWLEGDIAEEDIDVMDSLAKRALKVACNEITDDDIYSFCQDGGFNLKEMIEEVLGI